MSGDSTDDDRILTAREGTKQWFQQVETLYEIGPPGQFISTGLIDLDEILVGGWCRSNLSVLGARPGMGKTTFLLQTALHAALNEDCTVAIAPLQHGVISSTYRLSGLVTGVERARIRRGKLSEADWQKLFDGSQTLAESPMHWLTTPRICVEELAEQCEVLAEQEGLDVLFVDCLQMVTAPGEFQSYQEEVSEAVRGLRQIAEEQQIAVVATAQLNRKPEHRADPRPVMVDLRSSGEIEAMADQVLLLFREELYDPETDRSGLAEVSIAKNRLGPTGTIELTFEGPPMRFGDIS